MSLGALLAVWAGSHIFGTLMGAFNVAYAVSETRSWWTRQLLRLGRLVIAAVVVIVATAIFLDGDQLARLVGGSLHLGSGGVSVFSMFVLLVGAELASEIHQGNGAIDPERGAVYLGRIVSESGPGRASMEMAKRAR